MLWALACALLLQGDDRGLDGLGYAEIESPAAMIEVGPWRAWLESPGGELPFELVIARDGAKFAATIQNGEEKIPVPETRIDGDQIVFDMPHYDSRITAKIAPLGTRIDGEWKKRSGLDRWTTLKFHAEAGAAPRFKPLAEGVVKAMEGRWSVHFTKSEESGVLILHKGPEQTVEGTFLMPTGDFRWLAGSIQGQAGSIPGWRVRLSCFDGAHAFLFDAKTSIDEWAGKFWSGDRWEDTWQAEFNLNAALPDGFDAAHWKDGFGLAQLLYPDLNGVEHSLGESALGGKAIVIQVLGSWCPNCHDEMAYLAKVYDRYKDRGLSVVGLAFEVTGDWTRDAQQVRRMCERHGAKYPVLLAGSSDKQKASEAFPALDHVVAFPTTIFLHRDGRVRAVHSGFAGPATKEEHEKLAKGFERIIEELLAEPDGDDTTMWRALTASPWRGIGGKQLVRFSDGTDGSHLGSTREIASDRYPSHADATSPVWIHGTAVGLGGRLWCLDPRSGELVDPRDLANRLSPAIHGEPVPAADLDATRLVSDPDLLARTSMAFEAGESRNNELGPALIVCTKHGFAPLRREAATALGKIRFAPGADALRSLQADLDPLVREAAARALQNLGPR